MESKTVFSGIQLGEKRNIHMEIEPHLLSKVKQKIATQKEIRTVMKMRQRESIIDRVASGDYVSPSETLLYKEEGDSWKKKIEKYRSNGGCIRGYEVSYGTHEDYEYEIGRECFDKTDELKQRVIELRKTTLFETNYDSKRLPINWSCDSLKRYGIEKDVKNCILGYSRTPGN
jgi:hypothetical protein